MRWIFLLVLLVLQPIPSIAQSVARTEWPAGLLELEEIALKQPGAGPAFGCLCATAAEHGLLPALRDRWKERRDPAALVLLGWLEHETSNPVEAQSWFAKAVAIEPTFYPALWAHAWSLNFTDDAQADDAARLAFEAARTDEERYAPIELVANRLKTRGDHDAAHRHMATAFSNAKSVGMRLLLVPDLVAAKIADGTIEQWHAELAQARISEKWEAIAVYATACLALNEPGVALHEARNGLLRHPDQPSLRRIAATSALRARFVTEAGELLLSGLGPQADAVAVGEVMEALVEAGAGRAICELARRYPVELAAASRWREHLPALRNLGILADLRAALVKGTTADAWEAQVALAEITMLERNHQAAGEHFWRVLTSATNQYPLATSVIAEGNRTNGAFVALPLSGIRLHARWEEAIKLYQDASEIFSEYESKISWKIFTLADARDYALVCLHQLALLEGTEEAFLTRLRKVSREWPLEEQLLAAAILGSPEWIVNAAERIAGKPAEDFHWYTLSFARNQLSRVNSLPWVDPSLAQRARSVKLPERKDPAPKFATLNPRWKGMLLESYNFFLNGKLDEASNAFKATIPVVRKYGVREMGTFYNGLISALPAMPAGSRPAGARLILEWMARESASRLDLPLPPDFSLLIRKNEIPIHFYRMFVPPGDQGTTAYGVDSDYGIFPGSLVTREQSETLWYWRTELREMKDKSFKLAGTPLTGRERHHLAAYLAMLAVWDHDQSAVGTLLSELDGTPAEMSAKILRLWNEMNPQRGEENPGRKPAFAIKGFEAPNFTAHRGALAVIAPNRVSVDEFSLLHPSADDQLKILRALEKSVPAVGAQLALKWPSAIRKNFELQDAALLLRKSVLAADVDQALTLAREVLATPPHPNRLTLESTFWNEEEIPSASKARYEALSSLREFGELRGWMEDAANRFSANQKDFHLGWSLVEAARYVRILAGADSSSKKGGLDAHVATYARKTEISVLAVLSRENPEPKVWRRWQECSPGKEELGMLHTSLAEFLGSPAANTLSPYEAAQLLGMVPAEKLPPILTKFIARDFSPGYPVSSLSSLAEVGKPMWIAGFKREAISWWQHLLRKSHPLDASGPGFQQMLFAKCSELGDVDLLSGVIADAIQMQCRPALGPLAFPLPEKWGNSARYPKLSPLLETAKRHGVADKVAGHLEEKVLTDIALLTKAVPGLAASSDQVRTRLREREVKPLSSALLEEFVDALSKDPDPEGLAPKILDELETYRLAPDPALAVPRMARHGRIAAQIGHESATNLLASVAANFKHLSTSEQIDVMPDFLEGVVKHRKTALVRYASNLHTTLHARHHFNLDPLFTWLQSAADRGDRLLFASLSETVQGSRAYKEKSDYAFEKFISIVRAFAAKSGDFGDATPIAWVLPPEADTSHGETLIAWDVGWQAGLQGQRAFWNVAGSAGPKSGEKYTVELFWGEQPNRLESLRTIEDAQPSGTASIRLPRNARWLSVCLRAGNKSILGAPRPVTTGASFVRLAEALKLPGWSTNEGGPGGTYFAPVSVEPHSHEHGTLITDYALDKQTNIHLSAWVRKSGLRLIGRDAGGKETAQHYLQNLGTLGWNQVETTCGITSSDGGLNFPDTTVKLEVYSLGSTEISSLAAIRYRAPVRER